MNTLAYMRYERVWQLDQLKMKKKFSCLQFIKNKVWNRLDKILENCITINSSEYNVETFPDDKAFDI